MSDDAEGFTQIEDETAALYRALRSALDDETTNRLFPVAWRQLQRIRDAVPRTPHDELPRIQHVGRADRPQKVSQEQLELMDASRSSVTSEQVRLYHAVCAGEGKEVGDKLFPHVARHLARLDTGVKNLGELNERE